MNNLRQVLNKLPRTNPHNSSLHRRNMSRNTFEDASGTKDKHSKDKSSDTKYDTESNPQKDDVIFGPPTKEEAEKLDENIAKIENTLAHKLRTKVEKKVESISKVEPVKPEPISKLEPAKTEPELEPGKREPWRCIPCNPEPEAYKQEPCDCKVEPEPCCKPEPCCEPEPKPCCIPEPCCEPCKPEPDPCKPEPDPCKPEPPKPKKEYKPLFAPVNCEKIEKPPKKPMFEPVICVEKPVEKPVKPLEKPVEVSAHICGERARQDIFSSVVNEAIFKEKTTKCPPIESIASSSRSATFSLENLQRSLSKILATAIIGFIGYCALFYGNLNSDGSNGNDADNQAPQDENEDGASQTDTDGTSKSNAKVTSEADAKGSTKSDTKATSETDVKPTSKTTNGK